MVTSHNSEENGVVSLHGTSRNLENNGALSYHDRISARSRLIWPPDARNYNLMKLLWLALELRAPVY